MLFSCFHPGGSPCCRARQPQGLLRRDLQAPTAALQRDTVQPAPAFLILLQQGGPISSLECPVP